MIHFKTASYLLKNSIGSDDYVCFVEGYDTPYYLIRVESITGKKTHFIESKGKKSVIELFSFFNSKRATSLASMLFFVDRDYVDNSNLPEEVFVTDGYSVENYYTSLTAFGRILTGFFHVEEESEEYRAALELYRDEMEVFLQGATLFNAWYKTAREKDSNTLIKMSPSLPAKYVCTERNQITIQPYSLETIQEDYPEAIHVTQEEVDKNLDNVRTSQLNVRGKYMHQFLEYMLLKMKSDSQNAQRYIKIKNRAQISRSTLISDFTGYADTSIPLRDYLLRR